MVIEYLVLKESKFRFTAVASFKSKLFGSAHWEKGSTSFSLHSSTRVHIALGADIGMAPSIYMSNYLIITVLASALLPCR